MFILPPEELELLTGKSQKKAQCRELRKMGVKFGQRLDGWPIVTKESVHEYIGLLELEEKAQPEFKLNLDGL